MAACVSRLCGAVVCDCDISWQYSLVLGMYYLSVWSRKQPAVADLGGALGASAPPAESMVKYLNLPFSSQCTVGTFLRVLLAP